MIGRLGTGWRSFGEGRTGRRFRDRYHRRRGSGERTGLSTALTLAGGAALVLAGLVMVVAPGPGWVTVCLGLGLISGESLPVARLLDRAEVKGRRLLRRAARLRQGSPGAAWSIAGSLALLSAALGYGGYLLASA